MNTVRRLHAGVHLLPLMLLLAGCHTVPETGRSGLSLVPESQLVSAADQTFQQMKREVPVSRDAALNARVRTIGERIVRASGNPELPPAEQWEFVVFDDDQINAFAMPGGKVGFYTGMLNIMGSDDEIAVVMGHEIAHVAAKHGNERVSRQLLTSFTAVGLGFAVRNQSEELQQAIYLAYGLGTTLGVALPFSRQDEREADEIGLIYSSRAGYDPRASITFWEKMGTLSKGAPPEFLSTHPSYGTRINHLRAIMPRAMEEYRAAKARGL